MEASFSFSQNTVIVLVNIWTGNSVNFRPLWGSRNTQAGNHAAGPDGSYREGIVFNHRFYGANETGIPTVEQQVGQVTQYVHEMLTLSENGTVSNSYPVGTKIYEVPGVDISQVIGIQDSNGKYLEIEADPYS